MITASKLIMKLQQAQRELATDMLQRPAQDFPRYRQLVGKHEGLQDAINIIKELQDADE